MVLVIAPQLVFYNTLINSVHIFFIHFLFKKLFRMLQIFSITLMKKVTLNKKNY